MDLKMTNLRVDAGGEGSRGGKIVGHTTSGKPIYAKHSHPSHKEFTEKDHREAMATHDKLMVPPGMDPEEKKVFAFHRKQRKAHFASAEDPKGQEAAFAKSAVEAGIGKKSFV